MQRVTERSHIGSCGCGWGCAGPPAVWSSWVCVSWTGLIRCGDPWPGQEQWMLRQYLEAESGCLMLHSWSTQAQSSALSAAERCKSQRKCEWVLFTMCCWEICEGNFPCAVSQAPWDVSIARTGTRPPVFKENRWPGLVSFVSSFPSGTRGTGEDSAAENEPTAAVAFRGRFHIPTFCDENFCHKINRWFHTSWYTMKMIRHSSSWGSDGTHWGFAPSNNIYFFSFIFYFIYFYHFQTSLSWTFDKH